MRRIHSLLGNYFRSVLEILDLKGLATRFAAVVASADTIAGNGTPCLPHQQEPGTYRRSPAKNYEQLSEADLIEQFPTGNACQPLCPG